MPVKMHLWVYRQKNRCTRAESAYSRTNFFPLWDRYKLTFLSQKTPSRKAFKRSGDDLATCQFLLATRTDIPGAHKFSYFFAKWSNLNISFENLKNFYSKPIQWISKNARQNATLAFFQKNRCTRAERAYSRTNG